MQSNEQTKAGDPKGGQKAVEWSLDQIIDPNHALVRLSQSIDWGRLMTRFVQTFVPPGEAPSLPVRLAVGLSILKQMYELPDDVLCLRWVENPYYQFFCGEKHLQHHPPFDPSLTSSLPPIGDRKFRALFRECLSGTDADQGIHATDFPRAYTASLSASARMASKAVSSPDDDDGTSGGGATNAKPASIYDVAKQAGVSIKTVSLVINQRPNVSSKTRATVLDAIKALSYRPNVFARGLASEQSYLIALLSDRPSTGYVSDLQFGALDRCRQAGYHLVVEPIEGVGEELSRRVRRLLASTGLHGVIVTPPLCDSVPLLNEILRAHTPCVRISPGAYVAGLSTIGIDDQKAGYDVTAYLISLGHRRIGFIKGPPDHGAVTNRFRGYRAALSAFDIPFSEESCAQGFLSFQSGREAAEQLLSLQNRPTAIFAANDEMAAGVVAAAQRFSLKIPGELSVVGFDDAMAAKIVWPPLTTCRQPVKEMAAAAISMLLKRESKWMPSDQRLDHELIVRDSTARPPES
jgi:LacI family transcriptional regulator